MYLPARNIKLIGSFRHVLHFKEGVIINYNNQYLVHFTYCIFEVCNK